MDAPRRKDRGPDDGSDYPPLLRLLSSLYSEDGAAVLATLDALPPDLGRRKDLEITSVPSPSAPPRCGSLLQQPWACPNVPRTGGDDLRANISEVLLGVRGVTRCGGPVGVPGGDERLKEERRGRDVDDIMGNKKFVLRALAETERILMRGRKRHRRAGIKAR